MSTNTRAERAPVIAALPALKRQIMRFTGIGLVVLILLWLLVNLVKSPGQFINVFLSGVTNGSIYALVALGYTLVYGILELINFAHGDVFTWGGMMSIVIATEVFGLDGTQAGYVTFGLCALTLLGAMAFCGLLNVTIERVAYRRLRHAPRLAPLITAIGVSFLLQNAAAYFFSFNYRQLPQLLPTNTILTVGGADYKLNQLIVVLITVPVLILLMLLVQRTRRGKAMRATAQDREAARMLGIDVDRTIAFTFALGGALAGVAGFLYVMYFTQIRYDTGFQIGLFAFTAAVLGGIGNLPGAALGGLLIGFIQSFTNGLSWYSPGSDWTEVVVFTILIVILVFRPQGLLGEPTATRS